MLLLKIPITEQTNLIAIGLHVTQEYEWHSNMGAYGT